MKVIVVFLLCIYVVIAEKRLTEISKAKRYDGKVENPVNNQNRIAKKRLDELKKTLSMIIQNKDDFFTGTCGV